MTPTEGEKPIVSPEDGEISKMLEEIQVIKQKLDLVEIKLRNGELKPHEIAQLDEIRFTLEDILGEH